MISMPASFGRPVLLLMLGGFGFGCAGSPPSPPPGDAVGPSWFADITEEKRLDFVHDAGPTGTFFLPQIVGSGAALFDFDNDGRLDIYLVQNGGPAGAKNRLYCQLPNGTFQDVSAGSGLDIAGHNMGVAIGDVNNDGWPDVLVTQYGGIKLFLNKGDGTFQDVTREAGLDSPLWATSASFVDYDRDGWLDLVVVHYVDYDPTRICGSGRAARDYCHPTSFYGTITKLFHNTTGRRPGPSCGVRFEDVTLASGLARVPGTGLGVVCADFTGDGWPDLFVANDARPNRLWVNQHDGTFKEEALLRGLAYNVEGQPQGNMGVALGDVDGDGHFDIFVTHLVDETNTLWRQSPRGLFRDSTVAAGLAERSGRGTGFGTVLADFDHDGALDLAVVNGRVYIALRSRRNAWARTGVGSPSTIGSGPTTGTANSAIFRPLMCRFVARPTWRERWRMGTSMAMALWICW
jgi:hypothetical protein